jgi:Cu+-exporting ATPase
MASPVNQEKQAGSCCGGHGHKHAHADHHSHAAGHRHTDADQAGKAIDPVCGMTVTIATAKHRFTYKGQEHFFCSAGCRTKFEGNPEKYLAPKSVQPEEKMPEGTIYTCPMHPEVRQVGPGSCPICGMALEPETVSLDDKPDPELIDMTRRFWIALALTLPVFVLEMTVHLGGIQLLDPQTSNWLGFALATPVVLWAGWPFFVRGWQSVKTRNLNMFTLIAMGTGVAYIYSVVATFAPQVFPQAFRDHHGAVAVYFEAAAVITVLVLLGPGAGTARPRTDVRCNPGVARACSEDSAAHRRQWRRRHRHRSHRGRRSAARAPRREGAGGRRGHRRLVACR